MTVPSFLRTSPSLALKTPPSTPTCESFEVDGEAFTTLPSFLRTSPCLAFRTPPSIHALVPCKSEIGTGAFSTMLPSFLRISPSLDLPAETTLLPIPSSGAMI